MDKGYHHIVKNTRVSLVLDLWEELVLPDGSIDRDQYIDVDLHLGDGYERYAVRLEPLLKRAIEDK